MNIERFNTYADLIQAIRSCPSELEQVLGSNIDLVDAGLVLTMAQAAEMLAHTEDLEGSKFLIKLARIIAEKLHFSSSNSAHTPLPTLSSQLTFFVQVFQTTEQSNSNQEVIYSLLKANLYLLGDYFAALWKSWIIAMISDTKSERAHGIAAIINNFSVLINDFPLGDRAINLEIAISGYEICATVFTRNNFSQEWANVHNNLGAAYCVRIRGKRSDNLEIAIRYFLAALEVRTREVAPEKWAETQNNLGLAYSNRIKEEKAENLEEAIRCLKAALKIRTQNDLPQEWAHTQYNLGSAYQQRIRGKKTDNQEKAICCYLNALKVFTSIAFPKYWADTQNNLGNVYIERILGPIEFLEEGKKIKYLAAAIDSYSAALKVHTYENFPERWAAIHNNLANAYLHYTWGNRTENLEAAIYCCQAALQVYTHEDFPEEWALLQNNLGSVFLYRRGGNRPENLEGTIQFYLAALKVRTCDAFILDYTATQFNLGLAYQAVKQPYKSYKAFENAIDTVESIRVEIFAGSGREEDKKKLAEEWNKLYQEMVQVCLEVAKDDLVYYNQAIEYVERSKARNLVELLANKDIYPKREFYPNSELYQAHCHQLEQLRREIPAKQRELEILISNRKSEEENRDKIKVLRPELNKLQQHRDELLVKINQIDSNFTFTQKVKPIPFSDLQSLADENTAIVEWYITGSQILTFIITHHHLHPIVISSSAEDMTALENWDREYRDSYQKQNNQWINNLASRLQNLGKILHIDEILSRIDDCFSQSGAKCNRLILIPHRYLHLFPLHALPLADGKLVFERFSQGVGYAPSCQLLKQAKDQEQNRPDFTRLFAIQNPTRQPARPLLGSQLEIDKIHQHFDPQQSIILKEAEATEANLYQRMEQMRSSHCLHFSCHGEFNHESPLESALLLADPEGKLGKEEAKLTLGEVFEKLYLNQCRLVTFSACESGMTDPHSISDEYIGLPSGFLYAGSPSIVSTLWSVDPIATTLLMVKFYHNLKRLPQITTGDVAISLNKAQKWLRRLTHKKWARIQRYPQFQLLVEEAFENSPKRDRNKFNDSLSESLSLNRQPLPFAKPYYWSAFVAIGI